MDITQFRRVISQGIGNNWVSRSAFRKGDYKRGSVASLRDTFLLGFSHSATCCDTLFREVASCPLRQSEHSHARPTRLSEPTALIYSSGMRQSFFTQWTLVKRINVAGSARC